MITKELIKGRIHYPLGLGSQREEVGITKTETWKRDSAGPTLRPPTRRFCLAGGASISALGGGVLKV